MTSLLSGFGIILSAGPRSSSLLSIWACDFSDLSLFVSPCSHMCPCLSKWHLRVQAAAPRAAAVGARPVTSWARPTSTSGGCSRAPQTRTWWSSVRRKPGACGWVSRDSAESLTLASHPMRLSWDAVLLCFCPYGDRVTQQPLLKKSYVLPMRKAFMCFSEQSQIRPTWKASLVLSLFPACIQNRWS